MRTALSAVTSTAVVALIAAGTSMSFGAQAVTSPTPSSTVSVSVVIPQLTPTPTATPTPKPSSSSGAGSGSGTGTGSNGPSGGGTTTSPGKNSDGSPIPPAQPSASAPGLILDESEYEAHGWVVATGSGYTPGERVQFVLYPGAVVIGSFAADEAGTVVARFRVPDDTRPGAHVVEATGWDSGHVTNREFTIVGAGAATEYWLWWVVVVLGVLVLSMIATLIYFRDWLRQWFGSGLPTAEATS